jgi:branched-chain amino acid transport system ATP-binding protein
VARTFQNIELFDNLTVLENLLLGRHQQMGGTWWQAMAWLPPARRAELAGRRDVENIIEFLDLTAVPPLPSGSCPTASRSGSSSAGRSRWTRSLLLLDEPVAGMNAEETEDMARFILDIRDQLHIAMIMVEHDMRLVMDLADRVMVIDFGQRIALGTPPRCSATRR